MHLSSLDTHAGLLIRTWTRYSEPGPPHPHVNPLFRAWAISSARGPAIPSLGDPAHMRNSGLTCGTGGLRAGQGAQPYTRPATSHANPLFQAWASSSAREPAIPNLGNPAHMQNSGLTCGTAGLRAEQQRAVPHGAARLACLRAAHEHCGHCASATQVGGGVSGGHVLGEGDEVCCGFRVGGAHERRARKDEGRDGRQGAVTRLG